MPSISSSGRRPSSSHMNVPFLGLLAGLIATFSIAMFAGRAGSEWFEEEVSQSMMRIHGLDGLAQATSSQTEKMISTAKKYHHKKASVSRVSSKSGLEEDEPPPEEAETPVPNPEEVPNENTATEAVPDENDDCAIKLANGNYHAALRCCAAPHPVPLPGKCPPHRHHLFFGYGRVISK